MYTGIYFCVADIYNEIVFIFMGCLKVILTFYTLSTNCFNENTD